MNKWLLWLFFLVLVCIGVTLRFSTSHEKMPIGCDEFGYLNLSKAMEQENVFDHHAQRIYLTELLDTLRDGGITENEIAWMIAPHAYHLVPGTGKIINQYPPATSFLLYLLPIEFRKILFPALALLLLILLPLAAAGRKNSSWFDPVFAVFIFIVTVSAPFLTELTRVNSLALTFGLLIASGMLLSRYPLWSCLLIALTVNFRVANLLMVLPALLFVIPDKGNPISVKKLISSGFLIVLGILPLLYYNYHVTGNPFSTTYSSIDRAFTGTDNMISAFKYYFNMDQYWFRVHLLAVAAILLLVIVSKGSLSALWKVLAFPFINYLFFIFHEVKMDYYPYASAMILIGIFFGNLSEFNMNSKYSKVSYVLIAGIAIVISASGISRYMKRPHITYAEAKSRYSALCSFDVVWADLYSGTTEYVCDNNGFRFGTTTPRARIRAMQFFYHRKIKQAVLLDDNTVDSKTVLADIMAAGIPHRNAADSTIGKFVIIE